MAFGAKISGFWQRATSGKVVKNMLDGTTMGNSIGSLLGITIGGIAGFAFGGVMAAVVLGVGIGAACGIAGGAVVGALKGAAEESMQPSPPAQSSNTSATESKEPQITASEPGLTTPKTIITSSEARSSDEPDVTPSQRFADVISAQREIAASSQREI